MLVLFIAITDNAANCFGVSRQLASLRLAILLDLLRCFVLALGCSATLGGCCTLGDSCSFPSTVSTCTLGDASSLLGGLNIFVIAFKASLVLLPFRINGSFQCGFFRTVVKSSKHPASLSSVYNPGIVIL